MKEREEQIERIGEEKEVSEEVEKMSYFVFPCVLPRSFSKNKVFFVFFQGKSLNVMSSNPVSIC